MLADPGRTAPPAAPHCVAIWGVSTAVKFWRFTFPQLHRRRARAVLATSLTLLGAAWPCLLLKVVRSPVFGGRQDLREARVLSLLEAAREERYVLAKKPRVFTWRDKATRSGGVDDYNATLKPNTTLASPATSCPRPQRGSRAGLMSGALRRETAQKRAQTEHSNTLLPSGSAGASRICVPCLDAVVDRVMQGAPLIGDRFSHSKPKDTSMGVSKRVIGNT